MELWQNEKSISESICKDELPDYVSDLSLSIRFRNTTFDSKFIRYNTNDKNDTKVLVESDKKNCCVHVEF